MLIILNKNENQRDYNELIGTIEKKKYYNKKIKKDKIFTIKCNCGSKIVSYRYNIHLSSEKHIFYVRMIELDRELDSFF